ncbi:uncharacterized protein LOC136070265 [Quercus suber]
MAKVAAFLEQERARAPKERFYTQRPPYPLRILSKPYPERKDIGRNVYGKHDQGVQGCSRKSGNLRVSIVVADYKSTKELFGERGDEKTLDNFIPKSDTDFLEYAELVSQKLRPFEKSYHYIALLKDVMRLSMSTLKAADAKDVASSVTAIANEKLNAEKEANAGKKKAPRKKPFLVDKPNDEMVVTSYDALDDYDFM